MSIVFYCNIILIVEYCDQVQDNTRRQMTLGLDRLAWGAVERHFFVHTTVPIPNPGDPAGLAPDPKNLSRVCIEKKCLLKPSN